ncbi:MAG: radical SAM protein [Nitrospinae bacterium]|nr:radical SAM protein [Nitrospinota bacterium]
MLTTVEPRVKSVPGRIGEIVQFPLQRIHIELTNVCNFDCTFCPKQEMTRKYEYMEYDRVCAIIDQVAEYNLSEKITFHVMGEPFMHSRFFDILEHAAALGVKTGITTNGTYLEEDIADKIEQATVSQINVSLQTPDEESFKTRKSRKMDFDQYRDRILEFLGACLRQKKPPKIKVHFLSTVFKSEVPGEDWSLGTMNVINNTKELRSTFAYWAEEILNVTPGVSESDKQEVRDRIAKLSAFKWNVVQIVPNLYFETYVLDTWGNAFVGDDAVPTKVGYCSALTDHFAILVNGDLTYCCKDFDGKTAAGNVFDQPIVEVLNSKPIIDAIEGFKKNRVVHPHCQKCLGGSSKWKAVRNAVGSILIWRYLKNFFYKKS